MGYEDIDVEDITDAQLEELAAQAALEEGLDGPEEPTPGGASAAPETQEQEEQAAPSLEEIQKRVAELEAAKSGLIQDLTQERARRRTAEQHDQESRRRAQELLETWRKKVAAQEEQELDPVDRLTRETTATREEVAALRSEQARRAEAERVREQTLAAAARFGEREKAFEQQHPDYPDALKFVEEGYRKHFSQTMPPDQVEKAIVAEKIRSVVQFENSGINLAEHVYKLAQQHGWQSGQQQEGQPQQAAAQPPAAKPARRTPPTSLSTMSGSGAPTGKVDPLDLPEDEFAALVNDPAKLERLLAAGD